MRFKATLSNKAHPEWGQAAIPFPITDSPEADSALTELGYVTYHSSLALDELMQDDPAEQHQQMGGMM